MENTEQINFVVVPFLHSPLSLHWFGQKWVFLILFQVTPEDGFSNTPLRLYLQRENIEKI